MTKKKKQKKKLVFYPGRQEFWLWLQDEGHPHRELGVGAWAKKNLKREIRLGNFI